MRVGNVIYNLDGLPFRNETIANRLRDLLSGETGNNYQIEPYLEGGFVIRLATTYKSDSNPERQQLPLNPLPKHVSELSNLQVSSITQKSVPVKKLKDYELRQAVLRTNLFGLLLMTVAICLVLLPDSLLFAVLEIINVQPRQLGDWLRWVDHGMMGIGSVLLVVIWLSFLWQRAGALYRVTGFGVEARLGIIAHQTVGLRFQDIRSMGIKQTLIERLLNVGLLEFTSAGTDGIPVRFNKVANPAKVLQVVKVRMAGVGSAD
ncbi:MAG: PH domain-containing protein [Methyloglobulus sp.]|nr:PH domain-containing protein [Methyloglobulus sp.]